MSLLKKTAQENGFVEAFKSSAKTGYNVNVPLFVEIGDKVLIDTRSGEYMERV